MKLIILVAFALVAVAVAAPPEYIPIVRSDYEQTPQGGYKFGYESGDGSVREETAEPKEALDEDNKPQVVLTIRGTYSYTDPDGKVVTIEYKADENGFEAFGDSIPKGPARR